MGAEEWSEAEYGKRGSWADEKRRVDAGVTRCDMIGETCDV